MIHSVSTGQPSVFGFWTDAQIKQVISGSRLGHWKDTLIFPNFFTFFKTGNLCDGGTIHHIHAAL